MPWLQSIKDSIGAVHNPRNVESSSAPKFGKPNGFGCLMNYGREMKRKLDVATSPHTHPYQVDALASKVEFHLGLSVTINLYLFHTRPRKLFSQHSLRYAVVYWTSSILLSLLQSAVLSFRHYMYVAKAMMINRHQPLWLHR